MKYDGGIKMETFDAKVEKYDSSSEEWKEEIGEWWIALKPMDILSFVKQLIDTMERGEIIIRIYPDGKGRIT